MFETGRSRMKLDDLGLKVNGHVPNWTSVLFKIWAAVNSENEAVWYLCPEGTMDADDYIEILKKFKHDLSERNIEPSEITFQQDGPGI